MSETMMLSSLVQTQSMNAVLAPIAAQVSHLAAITKYPVSARLPRLQKPAVSVMEAVQQLALASRRVSEETSDEQLQTDMPPAYEQAIESAQALVEAAEDVGDQQPPVNCTSLSRAGASVLESTIKVLMVWDDAEVRKIRETGTNCLDRLHLVLAAKSIRGLVVCYTGFAEALHQFIPLADKRQKDLIAKDQRRKVEQGLKIIRHVLPKFSLVMQASVKFPTDRDKLEQRDDLALKLSTAITSIMHAVSKGLEPEETAASTLRKARTQLSSDRRYTVGPELGHYIEIILKNSMEVAHTSKPQFKRAILQLCDEVVRLRNDLEVNHSALKTRPTSQSAREAFDSTAELLCNKLNELDKAVADAVLDQVTSVFVGTEGPLDQLVNAAITSSQPTAPVGAAPTTVLATSDDPQLNTKVELFRRHSRRLSEVAKQAAEGTADTKRAIQVKDIAKELDRLTHLVVTAALAAKRNEHDQSAHQQLKEIRKQWFDKVQELTSAIDDVIVPQEFVAATEVNIVDDMTKCREATNRNDWTEFAAAVGNIQAKVQRMCHVSLSKAATMTDPIQSNTVKIAVTGLKKAVGTMTEKANSLIRNPYSSDHLSQFTQSLQQLLNYIHKVQQLLEEAEAPDGSSVQPFPAPPSIPKLVDRGTSPPSDRHRFYGTLSSSDEWITSSSPPSYDPAISTPHSSEPARRQHLFSEERSVGVDPRMGDAETQTPRMNMKDEGLQVVVYPGTLGGLSVNNPSMIVGQSWASSKEGDISKSDEHSLGPYAQPLQRVISAAKKGNIDQLNSHASALSARTSRLAGMAESAAASVQDPDLANVLNKESAKITRLTPQLIRKAEETALRQDQSGEEVGELDAISHQWAGHVRTLIEASQKANLPWSRISGRLVSSAKRRKGVEKEVAHISTQTGHMVDIATATIAAAQVEDAIGSTANLEHVSDPEVQEQIEQVHNHMEDLQKLTPELIHAAKEIAVQADIEEEDEDEEMDEKTRQYEHLNLLSHEWATKANVLMKDVDDITLGMSGPADSLLIAANSGDPALLEEQSRAIKSLASSLKSIAEDAVKGWDDQQQVNAVLETAKLLEKLSDELVATAHELASITSEERRGEKHQLAVERGEILRRDWAAKMQLLTAHIDDLTAEVAAPMDRLVSVALQASRTDGMAKDHLLTQFDKKAGYITDKMEEITSKFSKATATTSIADDNIQMCSRALGFLNKLTPRSIGAARGLSNNPGSAMLDHFSHLRRQWAAKAQSFRAYLTSASSADVEEVIVAFDELLQGHPSVYSFSSSRHFDSPSLSPRPLSRRSYSSEGLAESPQGDSQLETTGKSRVKLMQTTPFLSTPPPRPKVNPNRYSYSPDPEPLVFRSPQPKPRPLTVPNQSTSTDFSLNGSSASIFMAAQTLHEAVEEYYEEGNPVITLAKKMSTQMYQMAEYNRGRGTELQNKSDMIASAKAIAANALQIVKFANLISEQCLDKRVQANLQSCAEMIPTLSTQLRIIASVKSSTPEDASADVMLVKNAQNLMQAVAKTITAAEAAYVKGLKEPESEEESQATTLAMRWKKKLYRDRTREAFRAPLGARGLRKLNRSCSSTSSLSHLLQQSSSPSKKLF